MKATLNFFYANLSQDESENFKARLAEACKVSSRSVWYWIQGDMIPRKEKREIINVVVKSLKGRKAPTIIYNKKQD